MQPRVFRTPKIWRPFPRLVRLAERVRRPPQAIGVTGVLFGFAALIVVGASLLSLPVARAPGQSFNLLTSLFTATSAVCVVGLVVVDTGTYWSIFGQAVILGLVQLGGLGIMTASMLILIVLRRPVSLQDTFELHEVSNTAGVRNTSALILLTILITVGVEAAGALALWVGFREVFGEEGSLWPALFHAISAYNNAGFDIMGDYSSLTRFAHSPAVLGATALLIVGGGLSILVLVDVAVKRSWKALTPNSKIVLTATLILLAVGSGGILLAEFNNPLTLGNLSLGDKAMNSLFYSVAARTAGFNSIPISGVQDESLFLTMALMFIGGATGSTAGGIKVATFAVLVLAAVASVRGYSYAAAYGRRFSHRLVLRALTIATLAAALVFVGTLILTMTEAFPFPTLLFEVVSAFATVGLSAGITPDLTVVGKLTVIVIMFLGRLGPLTVAYALAERAREPRYHLPEKDVAVG